MTTALEASLEKLFARPPEERRIGRYRLRADGKLGQGGFAPVFLADELTDEASDETLQTVALKLFALGDLTSDGQRARIRKEGQALCKVKHDNVVTFNTMITDEALGVVAIVMEHVEGTAVDERVAKGRMPVKDVIALGEQMASALETIHAAGIIHRDLKPANIIEHAGVFTLIDFGISVGDGADTPSIPASEARALFADLSRGDAKGLTGVMHAAQKATKATLLTHGIAGTLGYVDPRTVVKGVRADEKSDLYALGVTLYECASGVLPTVAAAGETEISPEHRAEVSARIFTGDEPPPSISDVCPDVPLALASLIDAMVSPDAADRPANAAAVRERLRKVREDLAEAAAKPTRSVAPSMPPARTGIEVGSTPLSPEEQRRRDEAIRRRDARERMAKWRNRGIALLVLGGVGAGGYFGWKALNGPSAKEKDARDAWADFQGCLLAASPADAGANVSRWYVVRANVAIGAVDPKTLEDTCMPLGRTAYDTFRAARGPGADFLEKLSSYLEDVTHKGVLKTDPIPVLNAGLDADLKGGTPKTKSPVAGVAEAAIKLSELQAAKASTAEPPKVTDSSKCDAWMPPAKPALTKYYARDVSFDKTTGLMFGNPAKDDKHLRRRNSDNKDEDEQWFESIDTIVNLEAEGAQRVCDYPMDASTEAVAFVCNTPLFLLKRAKGVIDLSTTRETGTVKPESVYPTGDAPALDARTSRIRVEHTCHTSSRTYFQLGLSGGASPRRLFGTWTDGKFEFFDLDPGTEYASMSCQEGTGGWILERKEGKSTMVFCAEGGACAPSAALPQPPRPRAKADDSSDTLAPQSCFDGKGWYVVVGDKRAVGVKRWAFPFDQPPTTTLVFANTPDKSTELPHGLQCAGGQATLTGDTGVRVLVSAEPRILP